MSRGTRIGLVLVMGAGGALFGLLALSVLLPTKLAQADQTCSITWVGSSSGGSWATPGNWNLDRAPINGDVVCISGVTGPVTYGTGTTLLSELRSSAPISISGGEMGLTDITATENTVGGFSLTGGQWGDTTTNEASFTDTGSFSWTSGSFFAPSAQTPQPVLTVDAGSTATITDPDYVSNWNLDIKTPLSASGSFYFQNTGGITETNMLTLADGTNISNQGSAGPLTITSTGTLTKADTSGTANVGVTVDNAGTVSVPDGTLDVGNTQATGTFTGPFSVAAGSFLDLYDEDLSTGATSSGAGTVEFSGTDTDTTSLEVADVTEVGTLTTIDAPLDISGALSITGGEVDLSATGNSVGSFSLTGGDLGDTTNNEGSLTDTGSFSWTSGSFFAPSAQTPQPVLTVDAGSTATITDPDYVSNWNLDIKTPLSASGSFYFQNTGGITETNTLTLADGTNISNQGSAGPLTITSTGTLTKADTSGTANVGVTVDNAGTVSVPDGTLDVGNTQATGTFTGPFSVAAGSFLDLYDEDLSTGATSSGAGTVEFSGTDTDTTSLEVADVTEVGTLTTIDAPLDISGALSITGGEVDLSATGNSVGSFSLTGGDLGDTTNNEGSLTDTGSFSWTSGSFFAPSAQTPQPVLTVDAGSTATITDPDYVSNWNLDIKTPLSASGSFYFQNTGGITETNTLTLADGTNISNQGSAGPLTITSTGTLTKADTSGTANVGVTVDNAGTVSVPDGTLDVGSLTNTGTLNLGKATVNIDSNFAPADDSTTAVTIDGTVAGTSFGQLNVSGTATLAGTLSVSTEAGFTPTTADTFAVTTSTGTTSGSFSPITQPILTGGLVYFENVASMGATLSVAGAITPTTLPGGAEGSAYSQALTVNGGTSPFTWTVSSGSLPAGLTITPSSGLISGTPTSTGSSTFTVKVTDSASPTKGTASQSYTVVVGSGGPPTVTAVIPSAGPTTGGTEVDVSGTNFSGATAVTFGANAATTFTVESPGSIEATSPAGTAGTVDVTVATPSGTSPTSSADKFTYVTTSTANPYHSLPPARICDTRSGGTKVGCAEAATLGPGQTVTVTAEGNGGIPATGVSAVVVNVTVADTTAQSHLTVYPANQPQPTASNLNWSAGQTVPNLVQVGLSPSGTFDATNLNGHADVIVDVEGYFAPPTNAGQGLYNALSTPARICDTRSGNPSNLSGVALSQCEGQTPAPGKSLQVQVTGLGGVPSSGVGAVILNVTAIGASSRGYLTVYPAGQSAPTASSVNFTPGINVANRVIVPVSTASGQTPYGAIDIYSFTGSPAIAVDVAGWYTDDSNASAPGTIYTPASSPTRVCDTRTGLSYTTQCTGKALGPLSVLAVTVTGIEGIPADAKAVVLNVTAVDTTAKSHLTVYPFGVPLPTVSDINWSAGEVVPNLVVATVGTGGQINLENYNGSTDVIVDVVGWYS